MPDTALRIFSHKYFHAVKSVFSCQFLVFLKNTVIYRDTSQTKEFFFIYDLKLSLILGVILRFHSIEKFYPEIKSFMCFCFSFRSTRSSLALGAMYELSLAKGIADSHLSHHCSCSHLCLIALYDFFLSFSPQMPISEFT